MKKENRNTRILAENNGNSDGFNVYLEFSGQREYLMFHRYSGLLYGLIKDGMALSDLRRWRAPKISRGASRGDQLRRSARLKNSVDHLLDAVDDYMLERNAPIRSDRNDDLFLTALKAA